MFRNLPSRYAKARLLPTLHLRPSGFLYNTRNADSYTVNPVAACLVAALQRGVEPDALYQEVVTRFEVSEPLAHKDALQFLSTLHQLGLLTLSAEEQAALEDEDEPDEPVAPDGEPAAQRQSAPPRAADESAARLPQGPRP